MPVSYLSFDFFSLSPMTLYARLLGLGTNPVGPLLIRLPFFLSGKGLEVRTVRERAALPFAGSTVLSLRIESELVEAAASCTLTTFRCFLSSILSSYLLPMVTPSIYSELFWRRILSGIGPSTDFSSRIPYFFRKILNWLACSELSVVSWDMFLNFESFTNKKLLRLFTGNLWMLLILNFIFCCFHVTYSYFHILRAFRRRFFSGSGPSTGFFSRIPYIFRKILNGLAWSELDLELSVVSRDIFI